MSEYGSFRCSRCQKRTAYLGKRDDVWLCPSCLAEASTRGGLHERPLIGSGAGLAVIDRQPGTPSVSVRSTPEGTPE